MHYLSDRPSVLFDLAGFIRRKSSEKLALQQICSFLTFFIYLGTNIYSRWFEGVSCLYDTLVETEITKLVKFACLFSKK